MDHPSLASSDGSTLGARLRAARSERGLSIDEVAQSLKLSPRIITALEEDAYDRLPSPTYVRGYLRSYALLLGIPPQQLIDAFNTTPQAAQRVDMTVPAAPKEVTSSDTTIKFGTLLVVGLVAGLTVLWWSGKDGMSPRRKATTPAPVTAEAPPAPAAEATPPATAEAPAKPAEPPSPPVASAEKPTATPPAPATSTAAPQPPAPVAPVDPNAPRARLVLRITEDSWVDVRDVQQNRLVYQTLPAGRVLNVEGVPPLTVFLGNVEGVTVEFNGKPYDALRHKRGQVARFTLNSTGGN